MKHSQTCPDGMVEIFRTDERSGVNTNVVMWCPQCGSVTVDEIRTMSGRRVFGGLVKLRTPKLFGELLAKQMVAGELQVDALSVKDKTTLLNHVEKERIKLLQERLDEPDEPEEGTPPAPGANQYGQTLYCAHNPPVDGCFCAAHL